MVKLFYSDQSRKCMRILDNDLFCADHIDNYWICNRCSVVALSRKTERQTVVPWTDVESSASSDLAFLTQARMSEAANSWEQYIFDVATCRTNNIITILTTHGFVVRFALCTHIVVKNIGFNNNEDITARGGLMPVAHTHTHTIRNRRRKPVPENVP